MVGYAVRWGHERTRVNRGMLALKKQWRREDAIKRQTEYDALTLEQKLERAQGQKEIAKISEKIVLRDAELAHQAELAEKKKNKKKKEEN